MRFFDFLMNWKILNDIQEEDLSEEDELVDLMYINEQFEKERENKKKDKEREDWKK